MCIRDRSSSGNPVEYQFDWGDGEQSNWVDSTEVHVYNTTGDMLVKSRARSKEHTSIVSDWTNPLHVAIDGYMITIAINPENSGSVAKTPNKDKYASGETVELTAHGELGFAFDKWGGDASGTQNPLSVLINGNKYILAYFMQSPELISTPKFISGPDTAIVLQSLVFATGGAKSNLGHSVLYQFDWGDSSYSAWGDSVATHSYANPGTMNVKARARSATNMSVISAWTIPHVVAIISNNFKLVVTVEPEGTGNVNLTPNKTQYKAGDTVILTPIPASGYFFDQWSGDLTGISNPAYLIMNGNKNIIAHFKSISQVEAEKKTVPEQFVLQQNYPNPFNPETTISYQLAKLSYVKIGIYNLQGQLIYTLIDAEQSAGYYNIKWLAIDSAGNKVPSGVYAYRMVTADFVDIKKMILMK